MIEPTKLADSDGDPFMGRIVGGRFAILDRLGAGSTGTVYRARQTAMGRDVAIKIVRADRLVDSQAKERFEQEAHATSLLRSPHTVTVYDFGEIHVEGDDVDGVDGSLYLAMELLEGESLGDRLKRTGALPINEALRVVRHTLLSLIEAHDKRIIHRDLKPDNLVMVGEASGGFEVCKVLDFGIAKLLTHDGSVSALETQAGTVFGTPRYMSPEQAQGKTLDARSDLYALGVILYHMLVGHPPYTDSDAVVVMAHHIKTPPKRPRTLKLDRPLPTDLEALLMRVLEKKPDKRPQDAAEFLAALDELAPISERTETDINAVLAGRRRAIPMPHILIAVAAVCAVAIVAVMTTSSDSEPPIRAVSDGLAELPDGDVPAVGSPSLLASGRAPLAVVAEASASATASARVPPPGSVTAPRDSYPRGKRRAPSRYRRFDRH
jgi:serine/threonine-protein kinase